mmetsp:Transcript_39007/g.71698  ORF Transcript_39007/g.71698 Transcript_39007/m.71698 type:complete len:214 (+) Transcript_39007:394-1035(+)
MKIAVAAVKRRERSCRQRWSRRSRRTAMMPQLARHRRPEKPTKLLPQRLPTLLLRRSRRGHHPPSRHRRRHWQGQPPKSRRHPTAKTADLYHRHCFDFRRFDGSRVAVAVAVDTVGACSEETAAGECARFGRTKLCLRGPAGRPPTRRAGKAGRSLRWRRASADLACGRRGEARAATLPSARPPNGARPQTPPPWPCETLEKCPGRAVAKPRR